MSTLRCLLPVTLAGLTLALTACERGPSEPAPAGPAPSAAALPADLFIATPPAGARDVAELKADPSAGETVVVRGRIGGRAAPFVKGSAVFLLIDPGLRACNELPGDGCPTPWDYCCEPRESLLAHTATVQVVDEAGRPLPVDLENRGGLAPLAEVVVEGRVAQRDAAGTLVIHARRIHVAGSAG